MTETTHTEIQDKKESIQQVIDEIHKKIIGQHTLVRDVIIGLLTGGHILLEGVPGVAKTLTIDTMSKTLDLAFKRVQFTPDLLPSDLVGTQIYNQAKSEFETKKGPIFTHFLLADEINRAPSKVQAALLEAMAEKQITIGEQSYHLEQPFIVLATQNPIEQSGTYKLPEAELDRFMMKSYVDYPSAEEEKEILQKLDHIEGDSVSQILSKKEIIQLQETVSNIHVSENIIDYITDIISATRTQHKYLSYGVSPRGSIALIKASKAVAFLHGRDFVIPEDIKEIAVSALAHRLVLNYEAIAEDISAESIIQEILDSVKIR